MVYIEGTSIGEAYLNALKSIIDKKINRPYIVVDISQPILDTSMKREIEIFSLNPKALLETTPYVVNVKENVYQAFCEFSFPESDPMTGGNLGKDWINGRLQTLLSPKGYYYQALREKHGFDQLESVENRLLCRDKDGKKMHGSSTNALVCQVYFPEEDLRKACVSRPLVKGVRCLSLLQWIPRGDALDLFAVFRSQYFDSKAYGNFTSLALLLFDMCQKTGYEPGILVSIANNYTFDFKKKYRKSLYDHLARNRISIEEEGFDTD